LWCFGEEERSLNATKDSISKANYKATPNLSVKEIEFNSSFVIDVNFTWPSNRSSGVRWT
jgi:hypothetical protein